MVHLAATLGDVRVDRCIKDWFRIALIMFPAGVRRCRDFDYRPNPFTFQGRFDERFRVRGVGLRHARLDGRMDFEFEIDHTCQPASVI
ncbi:MAG: hypothetical protein QOG73_2078, partial [Acetobacteraceae bacterium]|nr:hypothetical protein [Acetobacteraceae bacterium]